MRSVKVMLLGIGLILVGIFFRLWSISYVYSERKRGMGFCCMTCICIPVFRPAPRTI